MGYDVFISHSSKDKSAADAVCAALEANGVRCWVAPRDIKPGENWAGAILRGINACRMMVLVFSTHTNDSPHIRREVERAVHRGIPIAPLRIADAMPADDLEYFLSSSHWMDALTEPLEAHLREFALKTRASLGVMGEPLAAAPNLSAGTIPPVAPSEPLQATALESSVELWNRHSAPPRAAELVKHRGRTVAICATAAIVAMIAAGSVAVWWGRSHAEVRIADAGAGRLAVAAAPTTAPAVAARPISRIDNEGHRVVDLLALVDPKLDALHGHWELDSNGLISDDNPGVGDTGAAIIMFRYEPPPEYEIQVEFTRMSGSEGIGEILYSPPTGAHFAFSVANFANALTGIEPIAGKRLNQDNPTTAKLGLETERKYKSLVRVRKDKITAYIDGEMVAQCPNKDLIGGDLAWRINGTELGIGTYQSIYAIHSIEVTELSGEGRIWPRLPVSPTPVKTITIDTIEGFNLQFSADGKRLFAQGQLFAVVWDLASAAEVGRLDGYYNWPVLVGNGHLLLGGWGSLYDFDRKANLQSIQGSPEQLNGITTSPGNRAFAWRLRNAICLWDGNPDHPAVPIRFDREHEVINAYGFSVDDKTLYVLVGHPDETQQLHRVDVATLKQTSIHIQDSVDNATSDWLSRNLPSDRAGSRLGFRRGDTALVVDGATGKTICTIPCPVMRFIRLSPDGRTVITISDDPHFGSRVYDVSTGKRRDGFGSDFGTCFHIDISPNSTRLVAAFTDRVIRLFDLASGKLVKEYTGHQREITDVKFSPDGKTFASSSIDQTIRIWKTE